MQNYVKALLHLYKKTPALYDADQDPCGFEWINADDADRSIFSFVRHSKDGKSNLLFVINFTPVARPDYRVGVPKENSIASCWMEMQQNLAEIQRSVRLYTRQ